MNNAEVKKQVRRFRSEFGVRDVTSHSLVAVFERQGFTIIDFNSVSNDADTETVIENLGLSEMILHENAFLYADSNYRLVFINEKLNEEERRIVLAHEEGHYYCGHAFTKSVIGHNVTEEQEANEFAHYLLQENPDDYNNLTSIEYHKVGESVDFPRWDQLYGDPKKGESFKLNESSNYQNLIFFEDRSYIHLLF